MSGWQRWSWQGWPVSETEFDKLWLAQPKGGFWTRLHQHLARLNRAVQRRAFDEQRRIASRIIGRKL